MTWMSMLQKETEDAYRATFGLLEMVDDSDLAWTPATGDNWMSMGQLLHHTVSACGFCFRGVITGDWGMPEGTDPGEMTEEEMLPPAEKMPSAESVAQVREALEADQKLAAQMLEESGDEALGSQMTEVPWEPGKLVLGHRLLQMVNHLNSHKSQLYYYLKLQGKPVNTHHLWGMDE